MIREIGKERDGDIVERLSHGETRVRFRTVAAADTPAAMAALLSSYTALLKDNEVHRPVVVAGCNLRLLCIHRRARAGTEARGRKSDL